MPHDWTLLSIPDFYSYCHNFNKKRIIFNIFPFICSSKCRVMSMFIFKPHGVWEIKKFMTTVKKFRFLYSFLKNVYNDNERMVSVGGKCLKRVIVNIRLRLWITHLTLHHKSILKNIFCNFTFICSRICSGNFHAYY